MKISTVDEPVSAALVDNIGGQHWLGLVVPKRLARRAVTRQLLKRQMREALRRHALAAFRDDTAIDMPMLPDDTDFLPVDVNLAELHAPETLH